MRRFLILFVVFLLASCASVPKKARHLAIEAPTLSSTQKQIDDFYQADSGTIISYVKLVNQIHSVDVAKMCAPDNIRLYEDAYRINPSSLTAIAFMAECENDDSERESNLLDKLRYLMVSLLQDNNGDSLEYPIEIRELFDAEILLEGANYRILDSVYVEHNKQVIMQYHVMDTETGEFEYRYFSLAKLLRQVYSGISGLLSQENILKITKATYLKNRYPHTLNAVAMDHVNNGNLDKALSTINLYEEPTQISHILLSEIYLQKGENDNLDTLVDSLFEYSELGNINATVQLARIFWSLDSSKETEKQVKQLLARVDRQTQKGHGAYLLAQKIKQYKGEQKSFKYWIELAVEQGHSDAQKAYELIRKEAS
ncbi:hypothetical protein [Pleionea sp. CnH1-48]|uniref:hypothetical protein n=1 Tax=Pleionea sp. CnH1-48 TaxID=2954494 RepID=UPI00209863F2|nr:hypothetical protein [Pleionea sp. CnH1-48]MCO7223552.1 hypothetical protein [Pleionea sp. CnH1-48]